MSNAQPKSTIAYLTSFYARASDTFIRREVEQLRRLGWTVHTFSIRRVGSEEQVSGEILREQTSTVYILEQGVWRHVWAFISMACRYPLRMLRAINLARRIRWPGVKSIVWHAIYLVEAAYLAQQLMQRKVKLLHNHIGMNTGTVAMLAGELAQIPFSMTIHGPHEFFDPERWAVGAKIAKSALTICISDFGKSQCMLFSPRTAWSQLRTVRCGLDDVFLHTDVTAPPTTPKLIYVGRLDPEKGFFVLLDAAAQVRTHGLKFELLVVGDGAVKAECKAYAAQLQLQDTVHFLGWRGSQDVQRLISECRALVLPSFAEGIPVVLMESMALQRPVITTQIAGIPELVHNGVSGWLVSPSSVDDLASAMGEALRASPEVLAEMGRRGRQCVLERHSVVKEVEKLSELFSEVLHLSSVSTNS